MKDESKVKWSGLFVPLSEWAVRMDVHNDIILMKTIARFVLLQLHVFDNILINKAS